MSAALVYEAPYPSAYIASGVDYVDYPSDYYGLGEEVAGPRVYAAEYGAGAQYATTGVYGGQAVYSGDTAGYDDYGTMPSQLEPTTIATRRPSSTSIYAAGGSAGSATFATPMSSRRYTAGSAALVSPQPVAMSARRMSAGWSTPGLPPQLPRAGPSVTYATYTVGGSYGSAGEAYPVAPSTPMRCASSPQPITTVGIPADTAAVMVMSPRPCTTYGPPMSPQPAAGNSYVAAVGHPPLGMPSAVSPRVTTVGCYSPMPPAPSAGLSPVRFAPCGGAPALSAPCASARRYTGVTTPMTPFRTPPVPSPLAPFAPLPGPVEEPKPPPNLTSGLPDPDAIDKQKVAYSKGLDEQLKHGTEVLAQQLKQQNEYLLAMGDQQKRQQSLAIDQQIRQQEMVLAQQHNEQLLMLQQAAAQQKSALEAQANALVLEYNQKKTHEELLQRQYEYAREHYETQMKYNDEIRRLQVQQQAGARQVAAQHSMLAQQVAASTQHAQMAHQSSASAMNTSTATIANPASGSGGGANGGGGDVGGVPAGGYNNTSGNTSCCLGGSLAQRPPPPPPPPPRFGAVQQSPTYYAPLQPAQSSYVPLATAASYGPAMTARGYQAPPTVLPTTTSCAVPPTVGPSGMRGVVPATSYASLGGDVSGAWHMPPMG